MKHIFLGAAVAAVSASAAMAQPATITKHTVTPAAIHQLDSLFHYLDTSGLYNGNIMVAAGGKPVATATIGYANLTTKEKLTPSSTFELASVSKQFTAVGILRLVASGKLKLDQTVETIFPGFPYKGVMVRHLLNHTGGLPDYMPLAAEHWDKKKIATNADVVAMLTQYKPELEFAPGTDWSYSNTGYALLGSVIEKVSGKSFADYMQAEVFKPFGLKHTSVYMRRYAPRTIAGYAYGYVQGEDGTYKLPDELASYDQVRYLDGIGGDGTVNTTLGDMLIWNNAVRDGKVLPANLWTEALTAPVVKGESTHYGFGMAVASAPGIGRVLDHSGAWPGYTTRNVVLLDKDVAFVFLGNKEYPSSTTEATWNAVRNITLGRPFTFPVPLVQKEASIDTKLYSKYAGVYESVEAKGFALTVTDRDGKLMVQATGQSEFEMKPESSTMFFMEGEDIKIEFMPEGDAVPRLMLHQSGHHEFKRK